MDYEQDIEVNKDNLIEEWQKQPAIWHYYADKWAEALDNERRLKEGFEQTKGKVEMRIRQEDPKNYGLAKWTEGAITSVVNQNPQVLTAQEEYFDARKTTTAMANIKDAIEQKKKSLEYLSQFWLAGFFAEPKLKEMDEQTKRVRTRKKLNKKDE